MCPPKPRIRRKCEPLQRQEALSGHTVPADLLLGAREVHEALCAPALRRIGNFDIACATVPAQHVSSDFVTMFVHNGCWFLAMGDLMGKGLSAAMWLTHVLDLLHRACETGDALPAIMQSLNREVHCSRVGVPLTSLFLARLDPATSTVTYSCGGCPPAFLLTGGQTFTRLESGGPILGAKERATYSSSAVVLGLQDTLLVTSDGVIEVHQGTTFEWRPDRVARHLKFSAGDSAGSLVQSLAARVKTASPAISHDLSLMAVQRVA